MRSAKSYSSRALDPIVQAWIARGGSANNQVLRAYNDAIAYGRAQGILYGVDGSTAGFARVNAFAGDDLASVLNPIIQAVGPAADVNGSFTLADHRNHGQFGGLTSDGTAATVGTKHIETGVLPDDLGFLDDQGAFGVWVGSNPILVNFSCVMGSWDATDGYQIRSYAGPTADGMFGSTSNFASTGRKPPYLGNHVWVARQSGTVAQMIDGTTVIGSSGVSIGAVGGVEFYVFALNSVGSAASLIPATSLGCYWMWKGPWATATDRTTIDTFIRTMMSGMGRGPATAP